MPDWDGKPHSPTVVISTFDEQHPMFRSVTTGATAASVWPTANRCIFNPFWVEDPVVVTKIAIIVVTAAGNVDVGIYDEFGNSLVTNGAVAVGAAGIQVFDITDTLLKPGAYFLAMCCTSATASFQRGGASGSATWGALYGQMNQAGLTSLPTPTATLVVPASAYVPLMFALCRHANL